MKLISDWSLPRQLKGADPMAEAAKSDASRTRTLPDGKTVNHTLALASLGGATLDNEENYLIKTLFGGGLGMAWIENQARV